MWNLGLERLDDRLGPARPRVVVQGLAERDPDEEDDNEQERREEPGGHPTVSTPVSARLTKRRPAHGSKSSAPRA